MKIIFNDYIPFKGFSAITVYPFIFVRNDAKINNRVINHEYIHAHQQVETICLTAAVVVCGIITRILSPWFLLAIPISFYVFYGLEYAIRYILYGFNHDAAYKNISSEQEAYANDFDLTYLDRRKRFDNLKYLFKRTYWPKQ